jgi:hypothetical protein
MVSCALLALYEPDMMQAALLGIIPVAVGIGYFNDTVLVRRDLRPVAEHRVMRGAFTACSRTIVMDCASGR